MVHGHGNSCEKYVLLPDDANYAFAVTATDGGTMDYAVTDAGTGAIQKTFSDVSLESGKQMTTQVGGNVAIGDEKLYVVDAAGEATAEVQADGSEEALGASSESGASSVSTRGEGSSSGAGQSAGQSATTLKAAVITAYGKTVAMGKTAKLGATVNSGSGLSYRSSNVKIAKVDSSGKVTPVKVGTTKVTITAAATGAYASAVKTVTVKVVKGANPMTVRAKTAIVKRTKVKKKAQTLKVSKVLAVKKVQGAVAYKLVSARKGPKSCKSKFKVNAKTGRVTVKKGTTKGAYKIKVKVKDAGNVNYRAKSVTRTAKIKVR